MGQKVNPTGIRLGITCESSARWIPTTSQPMAELLQSDIEARAYIEAQLPEAAGVSKIIIERSGKNVKIFIFTAKPGMIIGKKGEDIEKLRLGLSRKMGGLPVHVTIEEIRKPELDSLLVARSIAQQLERRVMFRRAMKRAMQNAMRLGAKGIKILVSGRLGGAEIARQEGYHEGRVPLHTFRADIDYGTAIAKTTYGIIGVKVWICKGEIIGKPVQSAGDAA